MHEEYAEALYEVAKEDRAEELFFEELHDICAALSSNSEYTKLLDTPTLSPELRVSLAEKAFADADERILNFILILCEKKHFDLFEKCVCHFDRLYDLDHNILRAEAVSAYPLTEAQINKLCGILSAKTGKNVILNNTTDSSVIGGIVLRYNGIQIDKSVRSSLDTLREELTSLEV